MSLIVEALRKAQKERSEKTEKDKGYKIATILSPIDVANKRRLHFSKSLLFAGALGGLILFFAFTILFVSSRGPVKKQVEYDISGQDIIEVQEIDEAIADGGLEKTPSEMELPKPEPSSISTQKMATKKILTKRNEIKLKPETQKRKPDLKTYARTLPPTKEPVFKMEKLDHKRDELKQIPIESNLPKSAFYYFNLGVFYQGEGKLKKAKEQYERVISLEPLNAEAHNNLGMVYKDLGELDRAIKEYRKALTLDPRYNKAHYNLAVALYLKGDLRAAASESKLAISLDPNDLEGYNTLGLIYKKGNKTPEAIEIFRKALAINPAHSQTHYNLALLLEEDEKIKEAIFHYQKFIELSKFETNQALIEKVKNHLKQIALP